MPRKKQQPAPQKRLTEDQINTFGEIFPGFAEWYRANHDEEGRYVGQKLPGLKPPEPGDKEEQEWGDIVNKPHVQGALRRMAGEVREQAQNGETEEGGFAIEENGNE